MEYKAEQISFGAEPPFTGELQFSLILACYLDAPHLANNFRRIAGVLIRAGISFEVIFVNDASPDHTDEELEKTRVFCEKKGFPMRVIRNERNRGRGYCIQEGIRAARAPVCGYIDIDLEPDPAVLPELIRLAEEHDVAVGSRRFLQEEFSVSRFLMHHVHRRVVSAALRLSVRDPHAGVKVFRRDSVLPHLDSVRDKHWFWDTELLSHSQDAGLSITERPVTYVKRVDKKTTVRLAADTRKEVSALASLYWRRHKEKLVTGALIAAILFVGVFLRLTSGDMIEYKGDESLTVEYAMSDAPAWNWLGLDTSNGGRHPGLGLSVYSLAKKAFSLYNPIQFARVTQVLSCLALLAFAAFLFFGLRRSEERVRRAWYWAFAFICVNPLHMIWERKIWQPSLLPVFFMVVLLAWWRRKHSAAYVFLWGLAGAVCGQVHLSAYFFALALFLGTLIWDKGRSEIRWRWWVTGSALGALPLIPWLMALPQSDAAPLLFKVHRLFTFKFFNYWLSNPMAWPFRGSLGADLAEFLSYPLLAGRATYLMGASFALVMAGGGFFLLLVAREAHAWWKAGRKMRPAGTDDTDILLLSGGLICGVLVTFSGLNVTRYFLLSVWMLPMLFFARIFLRHSFGEKFLAVMLACQLLLSAGFLHFVSGKEILRGDFGRPFARQGDPMYMYVVAGPPGKEEPKRAPADQAK